MERAHAGGHSEQVMLYKQITATIEKIPFKGGGLCPMSGKDIKPSR